MSNADWLTAALVIITAIYAWTTFRILRANESVVAAMQDQTVAQLRPYISVSVVPRIGTTLLSLEVINSGRSAATNVRLSMDRDFYAHAERQESSNIPALAYLCALSAVHPADLLLYRCRYIGVPAVRTEPTANYIHRNQAQSIRPECRGTGNTFPVGCAVNARLPGMWRIDGAAGGKEGGQCWRNLLGVHALPAMPGNPNGRLTESNL